VHHACATTTHTPVKPRESALIPFCNVPPLRGRDRLHLAASLGYRLPSQTNTGLFCALCPHSCTPGKNFSVGHPCSRPITLNLKVICRWASGKEVATLLGMSILLILLSPGPGCYILVDGSVFFCVTLSVRVSILWLYMNLILEA
jgi:hypothetical protein